jgi:hypothetical protein
MPASEAVSCRSRTLLALLTTVLAGRGFAAESASPPAIRIDDVVVAEGNPRTLTLEPLATLTEHAWAWGSEAKLFRDGSRLYVPLGYRGLAVYDVSDPRVPRLLVVVDRFLLGGQGGAVAASGDRAYVAIPVEQAIVVLDLAQPAAPKVLARFANIPDIQQLALRGRYLFVNAGSSYAYQGGVYVFDVSVTPPVAAGAYLTNLVDPGFYVSDSGTVYLARTPATAEDSAKIDAVDMSVPGSPRVLGQWASPYPGNIWDIDLREGRLYCAAYWGGLWVLDATDPSHLSLVARFDWDDPVPAAVGVQAAPPYVFLAGTGYDPSYWKFQVFEVAGGCVSLEQEIPATLPVHSVSLSGDQLVLAEIESPYASSNPRLSLSSFQVRKGSALATFAVSLSAPASGTVTVDYVTGDGSATAGSDYTAASGTITFAPGATTQPLSVAVQGDREPEPDETLSVTLSNAVNATIEDAQGQALIRDDDAVHPGSFFSVTPCRGMDTRNPPWTCGGGSALAAGADRVIPLVGRCGIPDTARAVSVNVTVTEPTAQGNLRLYPAGQPVPLTSTVNYVAGQTRANNAIVGLGASGEIGVRCAQASGTAHLVVDVNGYFQ